jgi:hypothetical protein
MPGRMFLDDFSQDDYNPRGCPKGFELLLRKKTITLCLVYLQRVI